MSNGIRGRPPGQGPTNIPQPQVEEKSTAKESQATKGAQQSAEASETPPDSAPVDKFERGGPEAGTLNRLQQLVGRGHGGPKLNFTSEDLKMLAQQFASVLLNKPNMSRAERAKAFAEVILKKKGKLKKLLGHLSKKEMEEMSDAIGNLLDSSPKFGQLVDDVSEEASKLNS